MAIPSSTSYGTGPQSGQPMGSPSLDKKSEEEQKPETVVNILDEEVKTPEVKTAEVEEIKTPEVDLNQLKNGDNTNVVEGVINPNELQKEEKNEEGAAPTGELSPLNDEEKLEAHKTIASDELVPPLSSEEDLPKAELTANGDTLPKHDANVGEKKDDMSGDVNAAKSGGSAFKIVLLFLVIVVLLAAAALAYMLIA
ncbi:MAG: hypothetical protein US52_C0004G0004 [candidate division WS6 bacterium GW2011_GWA2_37_6]|uniref:Uncharacterized protein n=1 Tax=candidate division WS6 bacterium GW2011_GWA2_37_6 TaxID=1619087 RepID=A0A0G0GZ62_9BACT|nr:MAG: hypothetical protein US52_C0004G0004 [candidate division WS6 bacterium GW2011_GWA2_37_6]